MLSHNVSWTCSRVVELSCRGWSSIKIRSKIIGPSGWNITAIPGSPLPWMVSPLLSEHVCVDKCTRRNEPISLGLGFPGKLKFSYQSWARFSRQAYYLRLGFPGKLKFSYQSWARFSRQAYYLRLGFPGKLKFSYQSWARFSRQAYYLRLGFPGKLKFSYQSWARFSRQAYQSWARFSRQAKMMALSASLYIWSYGLKCPPATHTASLPSR